MRLIAINAVWCPSCLVMKKTIKKIEENFPELEIIKYDYDLDEEEIKKYNVGKTLPVFIFEKDNQEINRLEGEVSYEEIIKNI